VALLGAGAPPRGCGRSRQGGCQEARRSKPWRSRSASTRRRATPGVRSPFPASSTSRPTAARATRRRKYPRSSGASSTGPRPDTADTPSQWRFHSYIGHSSPITRAPCPRGAPPEVASSTRTSMTRRWPRRKAQAQGTPNPQGRPLTQPSGGRRPRVQPDGPAHEGTTRGG